jgi:DNA polymerase III alpha subunit
MHGLRVRPIDINSSEWNCTLEREQNEILLRLGLRYVRGLRQTMMQLRIGINSSVGVRVSA